MSERDKEGARNLLHLSDSTGRVWRTVNFVVNLDGRSAQRLMQMWVPLYPSPFRDAGALSVNILTRPGLHCSLTVENESKRKRAVCRVNHVNWTRGSLDFEEDLSMLLRDLATLQAKFVVRGGKLRLFLYHASPEDRRKSYEIEFEP